MKELLTTIWQFLKYLAERFIQDGCRESAAALTYITLFALVPLLTLMYATFSMVPAFQDLGTDVQDLIFKNFLPESGTEIQQYLKQFSTQARKLSAIGAIILIVTSYMMLTNIEHTFNKIWGTAGGRKGLSSFLLYWAVLSLGPLLVGLGLSMNAYLFSYQWLVDELDKLGVMAVILAVLPLLFNWLAATLLFVAVPNCRVQVRYAVVGGLFTTVFFELLKIGFGLLVEKSSYQTVYGAFALVPLFLLWIYMVWTLLLAGAELVRALETFRTAVHGYSYSNLMGALVVFAEAHKRQQHGQTLSDQQMAAVGMEQKHWQELRDLFLKKRILVTTANGRYVLNRDLHKMSLWRLVKIFGENYAAQPGEKAATSLGCYPWFASLNSTLGELNANAGEALSVTVGELLDKEQANEAPESGRR